MNTTTILAIDLGKDVKRDEEAYAEQQRERQEKSLHRRAKELGYEVTKVESAPPTVT